MTRSLVYEGALTTGLVVGFVSVALAGFPKTPVTRCAPDAVPVGTVCMDRYEASVWRVPDPLGTNAKLVKKIQKGKATVADLTSAGALHLNAEPLVDDYPPCTPDGQNCANDIYAVSLPGVKPSMNARWFQAQEACANAGKRLPTSAEWQVAASGTPDPGSDNMTTDCNIQTGLPSNTGSRSACVSARGVFDMVGNLDEWTADWVPMSVTCPGWGAFSPTGDLMCLAGAATTALGPGALVRGGNFFSGGTEAGTLAVRSALPSTGSVYVGFRCAR